MRSVAGRFDAGSPVKVREAGQRAIGHHPAAFVVLLWTIRVSICQYHVYHINQALDHERIDLWQQRRSRGGGHDETKAPSKPRDPSLSLVDPANFLLATRDTGYKTTALAIAELIDNSLQAAATEVQVEVAAGRDDEFPLKITVMDNGSGMEPDTLAAALNFGGSTRFGDRSSLGRYGMGLPNGALSRARRVEVYSWTGPTVWMGRLDVDEVARNRHGSLPPISEVADRSFLPATPSGTVVRLLRCDRVEFRRVSTVVRRLKDDLGRIYRHFIAAGVGLVVNGSPVTPIDPLMLDSAGRPAGARQFGDTLVYSLDAPAGSGQVKVRFSELPVERWHNLTSSEKRQLGITVPRRCRCCGRGTPSTPHRSRSNFVSYGRKLAGKRLETRHHHIDVQPSWDWRSDRSNSRLTFRLRGSVDLGRASIDRPRSPFRRT